LQKASPHAAEGQGTGQETNDAAAQAKDPQNKPFVAVKGPLANLFSSSKAAGEEAETARQPYKASTEDHVEDSPVGTSSRILHRTFPVARYVHVAFKIPPHAVTPRFHGTFSSYAQNSDAASRDEEANVDLLLMNEPQYAAFAAGHDPDVLLIADTSHYQDIGFDLPPTRDLPVQYHLVFRNSPGGVAKKLVRADFTVDF
jgi:hypothetical protein